MLRVRAYRFLVVTIASALCAVGLAATPSVAVAHTCNTNWCSGSDSSTAISNQQVYFGEVGYYYLDLAGGTGPCPSDPAQLCFNTTAAFNADNKFINGTGMGTEFYYLGGGADSSLAANYKSPYCFGWAQANDAYSKIALHFSGAKIANLLLYLDIEQNNTFGWSNTTNQANRQVLDGFADNVDGAGSTGSCGARNSNWYTDQPAVYSSPGQWSYSFGTGSYAAIAGTPVWTYEYCCTSTWPGSYSNAQWFGGSQYESAWQYNITGSDLDVMEEPFYLPVFHQTYGT